MKRKRKYLANNDGLNLNSKACRNFGFLFIQVYIKASKRPCCGRDSESEKRKERSKENVQREPESTGDEEREVSVKMPGRASLETERKLTATFGSRMIPSTSPMACCRGRKQVNTWRNVALAVKSKKRQEVFNVGSHTEQSF